MLENNSITNNNEAPFFHYILYALLGCVVSVIIWFISTLFFTLLSILIGGNAYIGIAWGGYILLPLVVVIQIIIGGLLSIPIGIFYNRSKNGQQASRGKKFLINALWVAIVSTGLQLLLFMLLTIPLLVNNFLK